MNIYVGNLSYGLTEDQLQQLFEQYGSVNNVTIIKDNYTGKSKGFGFVEMDSQNEAEEAIKQLNGNSVDGRDIKVNQARPRTERPRQKTGNNNRW